MKKAIAKITAVLVLLTMVFSLAAANAEDSRVYRTLDEILESGTINIGVFSDKNPFGYVDENGEYQGYDVYYARNTRATTFITPAGSGKTWA